MLTDSGVMDTVLSDHALVFSFVNEKLPRSKMKIIRFRSTKNFNDNAFRVYLQVAPWRVGEVFDDVGDRAYFTSTLIRDIVDEHMPLKKVRVRDKDVP